jgi:lysophospholipase L1-like esterase
MDGSNLVLSGGAANYDKYVRYDAWATCLEDWVLTINFQATTQTAAAEGLFVGVKTSSAFGNKSVIALFGHGKGGAKGKSFLLSGSAAPDTFAIDSTSRAQSVSAGDEIRITLTRSGLTLTCLTENLTQATSTSINHTFTLAYNAGRFMHNTAFPYIGTIGGTQTIRDWNFSTTQKKNIKTLVLADSLGHGVSASNLYNRWANELLDGSSNEWAVNSGGGDYTGNVLNKIDELVLLNPQYVIMQLGGNDVRFGIPQVIAESNYTSIVNQLEAAGITVIHCLAGADSNDDMTSWNTWLSSNYTTIDCFTPLKDGGTGLNAAYDAGDGTHWNDAGHDVNAATILAAAPQVI